MLDYFIGLNLNIQAFILVQFGLIILHFCKKGTLLVIVGFFVLIFFIFYFYHSRLAIIAILFAFIYFKTSLNFKKIIYIFYVATIFFVFKISLQKNKQNSIFGRAYILQTNIKYLFSKHKVNGQQGINHFQIYENSKYENSNLLKYADNNFFCLNDWLQYSVNYGLLGFSVIGILFIYFIVKLINHFKNKTYSFFTLLLIPFHLFILFSYPLQINTVLTIYIFLYCCFISELYFYNNKYFIITVALICSFIFSIILLNEIENKKIETNVFNDVSSGFLNDAFKKIQKLNLSNKTNTSILLQASILNSLNKTNESISFLERNHTDFCSYAYHINLGSYYYEQNLLNQSCKNYKDAMYLVPHKIEPLYNLMNIYIKEQNNDSAIYFATKILERKPKIESNLSNFYKENANKFLKSL